MSNGRLEGAPTADDLNITDSRQRILYEFAMSNQHEGHAERMVLAECVCTQIKAEDVERGDFRYHYSDQLDAFILWEVLDVDHERQVCQVKTIDEGKAKLTDYWDGEQSLLDSFNKFYRPAPEDRARVEKKGFESSYTPMFGNVEADRRKLTVKLKQTEPAKQKHSLLDRIGLWLLGY